MMQLPPGVSEASLRHALQQVANVVGQQWVFDKEEDVATYRDGYTPFVAEPEKQPMPSAAVAPISVEEVQQIVRIANQYKIPLYTVSTGRNLGYGGTSPNLPGSVIVDLKRMKQIIEVNTQEGYMIVEPGVSFIELSRYLIDNEIDYVPSAPGPGWGSPIGNALDRGVGMPYGDNFSAVSGLEVVLANGEVMRTGRGAMETGGLWPIYPYALGPDLRGLFLQSNLGIVTKACFWITPKWEVMNGLSIHSMQDADLDPIIDALRGLSNMGLTSGFTFGSPLRASTGTNDNRRGGGPEEAKALLRRRDGGTSADWEALARKVKMPLASGAIAFRGPRSIVDAKIEFAKDYLAQRKVPGKIMPGMEIAGNFDIKIDFGALAMQPTNFGHYYFSPIIKRTREDLFGVNEVIRNVLLDAGDMEMLDEFGFFGDGMMAMSTVAPERHMAVLMEFLVYNDAEKDSRRRELCRSLIKACAAKGWGEYRAPVIFQDDAADTFSFNNHAYRRFVEAIYDAVDPNGILSPGRNGIWPKHLRKN